MREAHNSKADKFMSDLIMQIPNEIMILVILGKNMRQKEKHDDKTTGYMHKYAKLFNLNYSCMSMWCILFFIYIFSL